MVKIWFALLIFSIPLFASDRALILCLHDIDGQGEYSLSKQELESVFLRLENRYEVVSMKEWLSRDTFNRPVVVLTFDDGYNSTLKIVTPMLKQYSYGATFFFYSDRYKPGSKTYREIASLDGKIEIGSHSRTHSDLKKKDSATLFRELYLSRRFLEYETGLSVQGFAWPYGSYSKDNLDLPVLAGYTYQVGVGAQIARRDDRIYPRFTIKQSEPLEDLELYLEKFEVVLREESSRKKNVQR